MNTTDSFSWYETNKTELQSILSTSTKELKKLGVTHLVQEVDKIAGKMKSDVFRILVLGEFKRGKSSFINALLETEVLPAYATPCTAVINEISWSDEPSAKVLFKNPLPEPLPDGLSKSVLSHINSNSKQPIPPMKFELGEKPVEELEKIVTIPDPGKDQSESVSLTPFKCVEIQWPLEILRNDVQIIDSPGLNENTTRTTVTMDYLSKVDAVLFLQTCVPLGSMTELQAVDSNIRASGHEDIFFLCTFYDLVNEKEKDRIKSYVYDKFAQRTSFGKDGIHFISAKQALEAYESKNETLLAQSGVPKVRDSLMEFLANDRAKVKLGQPTRAIRTIIEGVLAREIPQQQGMLHQDLGKLRDAYDENKPKLDFLRKKQAQTIRGLEQSIERSTRLIRSELLVWYREFADTVPTIVENMELDNEFSVFKFSTKEQVKTISKEIVTKLQKEMEATFEEYRINTFDVLIENEVAALGEDAVQKAARLIDELRCVAANISGGDLSHVEDRKAIERGIAAILGFVVGGAGSSAAGLFGGYQEMAKSLIPQISLCVGMLLLGILNPWIIIPVLLSASGVQMLFTGKSTTNKIKNTVAEELSTQLRLKASEQADEFSNEIREKLAELIKPIETHLNKEIDGVEQQVQQALNDLKKGKSYVQEKASMLESAAKTLNDMRDRLVVFEKQLAQ